MKWRVYRISDPSNLDGTAYIGLRKHRNSSGWFWLRNGICLWIRVHGLENARYVCRVLNNNDANVGAFKKMNENSK